MYLRHARRFASNTGTRLPEDIKSYTLSRGTVGRKVFNKGWAHLEPRYPINLQERFHRAAVERIFHPNIIENLGVQVHGDSDTLEWRMSYETLALDAAKLNLSPATAAKSNLSDYRRLSPWHDIPLGFIDSATNELRFNFVNEIPFGSRAKMECATEEAWNPIKQDVKKGALRYFKYGDLPFNYGFIPQTWEDPNHQSAFIESTEKLLGDNDPIDVVEISDPKEFPLEMGAVVPIKVLGVLGLIDEGETDWKIMGVRADHPRASEMNSVEDANRVLGRDIASIVVDWFENYKVPDGKPVNVFSHNKQYRGCGVAVDIIEECHRQWMNLVLGGTEQNKLDVTSVTHRFLVAQGVTSETQLGELPNIEYPRLINWQPRPLQKVQLIRDNMTEDYDADEPSPDQERRTNKK